MKGKIKYLVIALASFTIGTLYTSIIWIII